MKWFNTLSHNRWLEQETDRIFNFGKNSVVPTYVARLFRCCGDGSTWRLLVG